MSAARGLVRSGAFTLIEVLVSLVIFALAAVVLGTAYVNVLLNYDAMQRHGTERSEIAQARAEVLAEPDRYEVERGGEIPFTSGGMLRWEAKVREMPLADLFRVELSLEMTPGGKGSARRQEETLLLLRPTWSDAAKHEQLRSDSRARLRKSRT